MIIASIGFLIRSFVSTQGYEKTTATVISVEYDPTVIYDSDDPTTADDHKVTLEYIVDGKTYTTEYNAQQGTYSVGDKVELKYAPGNPQNTVLHEMSLPLLIGISAAVLIIGVLVTWKNGRPA